MKQLEDEKNALLDYIEENLEKSVKSPAALSGGRHGQEAALRRLEEENSKLREELEDA